MDSSRVYVSRLVVAGRVHQEIELEAPDPEAAWMEGNDGIDPLKGLWVEVTEKKDPQRSLQI